MEIEQEVEILHQFKPIFEREYRYYMFKGGRGCIHGDTKIETPNGKVAIKDFKGGLIYATDGQKIVKAYACKSVKIGCEFLYDVKTEHHSVLVTENHRFLTQDGWKKTNSLQIDHDYLFSCSCEDLIRGQQSEFYPYRFQTNSGVCQKGFEKDVLYYMRTVLGWLYRCLQDYHLCDGQLLQGLNIFLDVLPLLSDELLHKSHVLFRKDDLELFYIYDLTDQFLNHVYNFGVQKDEEDKNYIKKGSYIYDRFFELLFGMSRLFERFREKNNLVLLIQESAKLFLCFYNDLKNKVESSQIIFDTLLCDVGDNPYSNSFRGCKLDRHYTTKERIKEVKKLNKEEFYDIYVPFYNNYIGNGIIHHNSGKSWGVADSLLLLGQMSKERILCTREIQKSIENSSYKLLCDRIAYYGFDNYDITKTSIVNKQTGTEFIFAGLSDITGTADSLKSIENISICWVEEAMTVSANSFKKLTPSIRGKNSKGQGSIIIMTYNPDTVFDPVYLEFVKEPKPRTLITHINYTDNPYCPNELIEEAEHLRQTKPDEYKKIWLGVPDDLSERAVVKYFTEENIRNVNYFEDEDLILTMDFNVDPMMWCVCHKDNDSLYQLDEIVIENCTTYDAVSEFINRYPHHKGNIILCGDASGNYRKTQSNLSDYLIVRNALIKYGYDADKIIQNTRPFNPPIKNRVRAFNNLVYDDSGKRRYFVDPKCKWTIFNMQTLAYKEGTSIIDLPTPAKIESNPDLKYVGHIFDAISYPVEYYWQIVPFNEVHDVVVDPKEQFTFKNIIERNKYDE